MCPGSREGGAGDRGAAFCTDVWLLLPEERWQGSGMSWLGSEHHAASLPIAASSRASGRGSALAVAEIRTGKGCRSSAHARAARQRERTRPPLTPLPLALSLGKEPGLFDLVIVNDDLEKAYSELKEVLLKVSLGFFSASCPV